MLSWLSGGLVGLVVVYALAAAVVGRSELLALLFGPVERSPIDFESLERGPAPNQYLVAPAGFGSARVDAEAPSFALTPEQLRDRWVAALDGMPRVKMLSADADRLQYNFEERSRLVGFPDTITVRFLPDAGGGSTLAVYSRSHYGYSDLGANEKRVKRWLALLDSAAPR
jgi:uncharacterized protein (DUF1499 family)